VTVLFDRSVALNTILTLIRAVLRREVAAADAAHPWHAYASAEVARALDTHAHAGLGAGAAGQRLRVHGRNTIKVAPGRSSLGIFASKFASLPVAVLAGAAVLSLATGVVVEAAAIGTVLIVNGLIGLLAESHAEATLRSLKSSGPAHARVIRDAVAQRVPAASVVPGDLLDLRRGTLVAADGRLVSSQGLSVSEAMLTGESAPVFKEAQAIQALATPLAERRNMIYRGTIVTSGSGMAVVVATGSQTQAGRVQRLVEGSNPPETPTYQQLNKLGMRLAWVTITASLLLFVLGRLRGFGVLHMLRSAVSLAVASVPEGLPMVATTTHAIGINALRARDVHVRKLDAIETLASVNVVCFDKTGTLTENHMSVAEVFTADACVLANHERLEETIAGSLRGLLEIGSLCSEVEITNRDGELEGSSTEVALVRCALLNGIDMDQLRGEKPRLTMQQRTDSSRFMVTTHERGDQVLVAMKGSPSEVLERCRYEATEADHCRPLTPQRRTAIEDAVAGMASKGLRVLGFARAHTQMPGPPVPSEADMIWLGAAGLRDPIRPSVYALVLRLHHAGVRTIMLTGDQRQTALAVAKEIGLAKGEPLRVLEGSDIGQLSDSALAHETRRTHVFARITPAQKLKIVRALQEAGAVIAMVGDGINDSPALRAAHVGVAMGVNGDAAAREVADIFLHTEDLTRLAQAVEQGRTTHANIRKSLRFILSTNTSEVLLMLAAVALGFGEGLTPMQLLWINIVTDVLPGIGLAVESPDQRALERGPPPPELPILGEGELATLLTEGATLAAGSLLAGLWGASRFGANSQHMRSMMFGSLVAAQLQHAVACRIPGENIFQRSDVKANPVLTAILAGSLALQGASYFVPPLRKSLGLAPVGLAGAAVMTASSVLPSLITLWRTRKSSSVGIEDHLEEGSAASA
jgi:Ca2+-transporting ATPase